MVLDIKIEDFRCKARLVTGGHIAEAPSTLTYATVMSRNVVRIAPMIAPLNDLEVKSGAILNAHVQAPVTEKVCNTLGPGSSTDARRKSVIVRALYSINSARAALRSHLAKCMESLGYESCKIYDSNKRSYHMTGYSITSIYYVMWKTFFVSIIMQMLCYSGYISPSCLSQDLANQTYA